MLASTNFHPLGATLRSPIQTLILRGTLFAGLQTLIRCPLQMLIPCGLFAGLSKLSFSGNPIHCGLSKLSSSGGPILRSLQLSSSGEPYLLSSLTFLSGRPYSLASHDFCHCCILFGDLSIRQKLYSEHGTYPLGSFSGALFAGFKCLPTLRSPALLHYYFWDHIH